MGVVVEDVLEQFVFFFLLQGGYVMYSNYA